MEYRKLETEQGYLSIISIAIIVVIAIVSTMLITMFAGNVKSTKNIAQSLSAFYLATSGLQITAREIITNKKGCDYINSIYNNKNNPYKLSNIPGGEFIVSCNTNKVNAILTNNISAISTVIPLNRIVIATATLISINNTEIALSNATSFPKKGTIRIDNEYIAYSSKNGNILQEIVRGVAGTNDTDPHGAGATVYYEFLNMGLINIGGELVYYNGIINNTLQNAVRSAQSSAYLQGEVVIQDQLTLTATAGFPDIIDATGKRIIQEILYKGCTDPYGRFSFYSPANDKTYKPAIVTSGIKVDVLGNKTEIENLDARSDALDFEGATILASQHIDLNGGAHTKYTIGETTSCINDVVCNTDAFDQSSFYDQIFTVNIMTDLIPTKSFSSTEEFKAQMRSFQANDIVRINSTVNFKQLNETISTAISPRIIIINGDLEISGQDTQVTIGKLDDPTIVFVNGNFRLQSGNKKPASLVIYGLFYMEGEFDLSGGYDGLSVYGLTAAKNNFKLHGNTTIHVYSHNLCLKILRERSDWLVGNDFILYRLRELFN